MLAGDFERTRDELVADGLALRRERDDLRDTRLAFLPAGPTIVELVEVRSGETMLWGLVAVVPSVDDPHPSPACARARVSARRWRSSRRGRAWLSSRTRAYASTSARPSSNQTCVSAACVIPQRSASSSTS